MYPLAITLLLSQLVSAQNADPCAVAADQQAEALDDLTISSSTPADIMLAVMDAETAFDCVAQLRLDADDAATVISIIKEYVVFQSTLSYLRDPPEAYQQPAVDILGGLDRLADEVAAGQYERQYDFDLALRRLVAGAHEGHLGISAGILGLFTWRLPDSVVAISSDGQELPQVYAFSDVRDSVADASPIVEMEDQDVFAFLESYANSSMALGLIDPHADWNQMMWNGPFLFGRVGSDPNSGTFQLPGLQATVVYRGPSLSGRFANGSDFAWSYVAGSLTDLLDNGWDSADALYEGAVLNQEVDESGIESTDQFTSTSTSPSKVTMRKEVSPSLHNDNDREALLQPFSYVSEHSRSRLGKRQFDEEEEPLPSLRAVPFLGYPRDPDVVQEFFGVGGTVSGYILTDDAIGVLSLPSFQAQSTEVGSSISFSDAVADFITRAKDAGVEKVVIDLSGNGGGTIFQGFDTAKRFFPNIEPSLGFRTRAVPQLNVIGSFLTAILEDRGLTLGEDAFDETLTLFGTSIPFSSALSLTTDGEPWASWSDFFGPREVNDDEFTNTARYNLSSPAMVRALGQDIAGFGDNPLAYDEAPWPAEDVILLHDGTCGSTCTIFAELLKVDAGVRSVAVGGIPQYGPMQGVSGTRGSNVARFRGISDVATQIRTMLASNELDASVTDLLTTALQDFTNSDIDRLPTSLSSSPWRLDGSVNILDEIRTSVAPDDPLQFVYQASDCRLFYTGDMIRDIRILWRAAAQFAGGDDSVCVPGSTDGPGVSDDVVLEGTEFSGGTVWASANSTDTPERSDDPGDDNEGNDTGDSDGNNGSDGDDGSGAHALQASFGLIVALAVLVWL